MKSALFIISMMVCTMNSWAADRSKELAAKLTEDLVAKLAAPWESVTVSMMSFPGCQEPRWSGVRVCSAKGELTISTWNDHYNAGPNHKAEGPVQPVTTFTREEFCAAILKHYRAAVASEDISEHLASFPTREEREEEMARILKAVGTPIGGFDVTGIDIRIVRDGGVSHFEDNYGDTGFHAFWEWLKGITPPAK